MRPSQYAHDHLRHHFTTPDGSRPVNPVHLKRPKVSLSPKVTTDKAVTWNKENIADTLQAFTKKHGRFPTLRELDSDQSLPAQRTLETLFKQPYEQVLDSLHNQKPAADQKENLEPEQDEEAGPAMGMQM